jgi:hypothetical protein
MGFASQTEHIAALLDEFESRARAAAGHQAGIRATGGPAQLMVEMRHHQPPRPGLSQTVQHPEQHHRIEPAGDRHQDTITGPTGGRADRSPARRAPLRKAREDGSGSRGGIQAGDEAPLTGFVVPEFGFMPYAAAHGADTVC